MTKPNSEEWEKEFDERFVSGMMIADFVDGKELYAEDIKSFIRSELLKARQEGYNEATKFWHELIQDGSITNPAIIKARQEERERIAGMFVGFIEELKKSFPGSAKKLDAVLALLKNNTE